MDLAPSETTSHVGSITDRQFVDLCCQGVDTIFHTASLHKPHIISHSNQDFIDTNVTGSLNLVRLASSLIFPSLGTLHLLEAAIQSRIRRFIFTSSTSVFGHALVDQDRTNPTATWITEAIVPIPKNIYGVTKLCAENLCHLFYQLHGKSGTRVAAGHGQEQQEEQQESFSCIVLRTSRFFPEEDDAAPQSPSESTERISDENLKYNEYLSRRVHLHDVISAHLQAHHAAPSIGYGVYIISSTTPFSPGDRGHLLTASSESVERYHPEYREIYERQGWKMSPMDRVYVNERARRELGWVPQYDYGRMIREMDAIAEADERGDS
jgi:UDP-glucose 4-epimerase